MSNSKSSAVCPICGQTVRLLLTAIAYGDEKEPAHFDCVLKQISEKETPGQKEKIIYLGGGSFGIVEFKSGGNGTFEIKKRIEFETFDQENPQKHNWRKELSDPVKIK